MGTIGDPKIAACSALVLSLRVAQPVLQTFTLWLTVEKQTESCRGGVGEREKAMRHEIMILALDK